MGNGGDTININTLFCRSLLVILVSLASVYCYGADLGNKVLEEGIGGTGHKDTNEVDIPEVPEVPSGYIQIRSLVAGSNSFSYSLISPTSSSDFSLATVSGIDTIIVTDVPESSIDTIIVTEKSSDAKFYYASVYLKHKSNDWEYGINIPYIQVKNGGFVETSNQQAPAGYKEKGLGDASLHVSYSPHLLLNNKTTIGYGLDIKFATADEEKGLGSGETDYVVSANMFHSMDKTTPFLKVGYKVRGDSSRDPLQNGVVATIGLDYRFSDKWSAGYMYEYLEARRENTDDLKSSVLYGSYEISSDISLTTFIQFGHSDSAADRGVGATVVYSF